MKAPLVETSPDFGPPEPELRASARYRAGTNHPSFSPSGLRRGTALIDTKEFLFTAFDLGITHFDLANNYGPDPDTPLEEPLGALDQAVRSAKAIYAGISSYDANMTREVMRICREERLARPIIHQPSYSMLNRSIENGLRDAAEQDGLGIIAFCPLAQGPLTGKHPSDIPADSRAASKAGFLSADAVDAILASP